VPLVIILLCADRTTGLNEEDEGAVAGVLVLILPALLCAIRGSRVAKSTVAGVLVPLLTALLCAGRTSATDTCVAGLVSSTGKADALSTLVLLLVGSVKFEAIGGCEPTEP